MADIVLIASTAYDDELLRQTAATFGRKSITQQLKDRLDAVGLGHRARPTELRDRLRRESPLHQSLAGIGLGWLAGAPTVGGMRAATSLSPKWGRSRHRFDCRSSWAPPSRDRAPTSAATASGEQLTRTIIIKEFPTPRRQRSAARRATTRRWCSAPRQRQPGRRPKVQEPPAGRATQPLTTCC